MPAGRQLPAVTKNKNYPQPVKHLKPAALRGAQTPQKQHAGLLELDPQPSAATIPSSSWERGAGVFALVWRAHIPDTYAA
jgi:hypothetical protein